MRYSKPRIDFSAYVPLFALCLAVELPGCAVGELGHEGAERGGEPVADAGASGAGSDQDARARTEGQPEPGHDLAARDAAADGGSRSRMDGGSTSGSGSMDGMSGPGAGGSGAADVFLHDDFEGATPGGPPDPSLWKVGAPNCQGSGTIAIDDAQAHGGARSVRVTGQGGYCNHIFIGASLAELGQSTLHGRFYVRFSDPLGGGHITFMALRDENDENRDLRMGGQSEILMWNRESDDATLPSLSPMGIAKSLQPSAGAWHCVEVEIDGSSGALSTWVDGARVMGLEIDQTSTPDVDEAWLRRTWRPKLRDIRLGWESYAGQPMTLWFDDVVFARDRIGCL